MLSLEKNLGPWTISCAVLSTHTQAAHNAGKLQNHISNASQLFMGQFWGSQSSDCFKTITTSSGSFVDQCLWRPTDTHAVLIRQWGKVIVRSQSWFCPILWTQWGYRVKEIGPPVDSPSSQCNVKWGEWWHVSKNDPTYEMPVWKQSRLRTGAVRTFPPDRTSPSLLLSTLSSSSAVSSSPCTYLWTATSKPVVLRCSSSSSSLNSSKPGLPPSSATRAWAIWITWGKRKIVLNIRGNIYHIEWKAVPCPSWIAL